MLVHPSERYVGLRMDKSVVSANESFTVDGLVVTLDGEPVADVPIEMTMAKMRWTRVKGQWTEVPEDVDVCRKDSKLDAVQCSFRPKEGATYRIEAKVRDAAGRPNVSTLVLGSGQGQETRAEVALEGDAHSGTAERCSRRYVNRIGASPVCARRRIVDAAQKWLGEERAIYDDGTHAGSPSILTRRISPTLPHRWIWWVRRPAW